MRLFASKRAKPSVRGRPESAPATRRHELLGASPLAKQLTKPKSVTSSRLHSSRRKKNAVHPTDKYDLERELVKLPVAQLGSNFESTSVIEIEKEVGNGYTMTIAILHALDLFNPCQIRSCEHTFAPCVEVSVGDERFQVLSAQLHARNYASWVKSARLSRHFDSSNCEPPSIVRVRVSAHCTRYKEAPEVVEIGWLDSIVLPRSVNAASESSQFLPVFRYQVIQGRAIKYYAGKVKLSMQFDPDPLPVAEGTHSDTPVCDANDLSEALEPEQHDTGGKPLRPSFLPPNFGDVLQLKRRQLKAIVVPAVINQSTTDRQVDNRVEVREMMAEIHAELSDLVVRLSDLHVFETIGEGVHATVYRVRLNNGFAQDVAMKEFRYSRDSTQTDAQPPLPVLQAYRQELGILRLVTSARSQTSGVVQLLAVMLTPRLAIFTDFCSSGSLAHCMQNWSSWSCVSMDKRIDLAVQISTSLACLHSMHIVHRDVKTHNIMVDGLASKKPIGKIGDLGSAVVRRPGDPVLLEETGSSGYTAPEIFQMCGYDEKVDIWSLGVVLWELLVSHPSKNPLIGVCGDELVRLASQGVRPEVPLGTASWISSLLNQCWQFDPSNRPSADSIACLLRANTNIY